MTLRWVRKQDHDDDDGDDHACYYNEEVSQLMKTIFNLKTQDQSAADGDNNSHDVLPAALNVNHDYEDDEDDGGGGCGGTAAAPEAVMALLTMVIIAVVVMMMVMIPTTYSMVDNTRYW